MADKEAAKRKQMVSKGLKNQELAMKEIGGESEKIADGDAQRTLRVDAGLYYNAVMNYRDQLEPGDSPWNYPEWVNDQIRRGAPIKVNTVGCTGAIKGNSRKVAENLGDILSPRCCERWPNCSCKDES